MKNLTKITDNIYRLTIPYADIYTTVFVIKTEDGAVLFDTAYIDEDVENYIIPMLLELSITSDMLKYVFISHNHRDHAWGLKRVMEEFPKACIVSRCPDLKADFKDYNFLVPEDNDIILNDLQIVTIPGHRADCCALLDTRTKTMLTGDSLQLYGIIGSGEWGANITLPAEHLKAVEKVRTLDVCDVIASHDYMPCGYKYSGREEITLALDSCIAPLYNIKDIILKNPSADDETVKKIYNTPGDIPTLATKVVVAVREAMDKGEL